MRARVAPLAFLRSPSRDVLGPVMEVLERLYAGVGDDEAFQEACRRLGRSLNATMIGVHRYDHSGRTGAVPSSIEGLSEADCDAYTSYWAPRNVWMIHGRELIQPGCITVSHLLCPDEILERSEWHNDFLRPHGVFHSMGCVLRMAGHIMTTVTFLRARKFGHYREEEQRTLRALGPHLENAFRLHERIQVAEGAARIGHDILERIAVAIVIVDSLGHVEGMNQRARTLLSNNDGLELLDGCLRATVAESSARLRRNIRSAIGDGSLAPTTYSGNTLVLRPSGRHPYQVWVTPLGQSNNLAPGVGARVAVFIGDPDTNPAPLLGDLMELYRLTPREARLGLLLAEGRDLRAAASEMNVSINTARTHLEHVFAKTCTNRQADLVRLLVGMSHGPHALT
jgi:DNA-binding CsgD family transcriptional regulator